jgi:hypothetical protein
MFVLIRSFFSPICSSQVVSGFARFLSCMKRVHCDARTNPLLIVREGEGVCVCVSKQDCVYVFRVCVCVFKQWLPPYPFLVFVYT